MNGMDPGTVIYPWLREAWRTLTSHWAADRVPQALLIQGAMGIGKLRLAEMFARKLLCAAPGEFACGRCNGCRLFQAGTHPDFIKVEPPEPGKAIGVDTIRELIGDLALKAQYGGFRVVVIAPAHQMNIHAANALLKTLEEPAERTAMLLLSEQPSALPATILSRCQKLPIPLPDLELARRWLEAERPGCTGEVLLAAAQGSPLKALALAESGVVERRRAAFTECMDLLSGRAEPVAVAERWLSDSPEEIIDWWGAWTADLIRLRAAPGWRTLGNPDLREPLQRFAGRLDLERLHDHWSLLLRSRRALGGQANRQLLLEEALIRWSELGKHRGKTRSTP